MPSFRKPMVSTGDSPAMFLLLSLKKPGASRQEVEADLDLLVALAEKLGYEPISGSVTGREAQLPPGPAA